MSTNNNDRYIPGVCNIGPAEIRMRRATGIFSLGITVIMFVLFYVMNIDPLIRLLIFIPAVTSAAGFLQAQLHFCAHFGMTGLFNVGDDLQQRESIDQVEYRRKDQRKAITIIAGSAAIGLGVALIAYWLPFA